MLTVGLTGGLACGKSTVASVLREKGCEVDGADEMGHRVIEPGGPAYESVVAEFGRDILDEQDRIVRRRLAAKVFGDEQRVKRLNELVHPHIVAGLADAVRDAKVRNPAGILVIEAALLLEAFGQVAVDVVVVVDCAEEQQVERFVRKGGTAEEARRRMAAQFSREERLRHADLVVDATGTIEEMRREAEALYEKLHARQVRTPS